MAKTQQRWLYADHEGFSFSMRKGRTGEALEGVLTPEVCQEHLLGTGSQCLRVCAVTYAILFDL